MQWLDVAVDDYKTTGGVRMTLNLPPCCLGLGLCFQGKM
jgi:hypothetical protein